MTDSPYLVPPGKKFRLLDRATDDTGPFEGKEAAQPATEANVARLAELQEMLYAENRRALLIVFQAMDAGGKDGAIEHVFSGINPQGCHVTSFKAPSATELEHDYLWRVHANTPAKGMIGIFNRSHYESVLVERVKKLVPREVWSRRYGHINAFEKLLADEGTTILKFYLHISKDEQRRRLQARVDDPTKHWKFNPKDLDERRHWKDYQVAFEDALRECSTAHAPWYAVPADKKWFRNWVVSDVIVRTLEAMKLKYPPAQKGIGKVVVR